MKVGFWEIVVVIVIALIVIGPEQFPEYAKALGKALREVKKSTAGLSDQIQKDVVEPLNETVKPLKEAAAPITDSINGLQSDLDQAARSLEKAVTTEPETEPADTKSNDAETTPAHEGENK